LNVQISQKVRRGTRASIFFFFFRGQREEASTQKNSLHIFSADADAELLLLCRPLCIFISIRRFRLFFFSGLL
jgi:hypothetical protein